MATFTKTLKSKIHETKLSENEYKKILKIVESGEYSNVSDFIHEAIREKLEGIEIIKLRDVDREIAKKEIIEYYKKYKEAYPDEVANFLRIDFKLVMDITTELQKENVLGVVE